MPELEDFGYFGDEQLLHDSMEDWIYFSTEPDFPENFDEEDLYGWDDGGYAEEGVWD